MQQLVSLALKGAARAAQEQGRGEARGGLSLLRRCHRQRVRKVRQTSPQEFFLGFQSDHHKCSFVVFVSALQTWNLENVGKESIFLRTEMWKEFNDVLYGIPLDNLGW